MIVKNLNNHIVALTTEIKSAELFTLIINAEITDKNLRLQSLFSIFKNSLSFLSYDKLESSEFILNSEILEFRFVTTSQQNNCFSGKIIISVSLNKEMYNNYLDFWNKLTRE